jgi:hypothetical protein
LKHKDIRLPDLRRRSQQLEKKTGLIPVYIDCCPNNCLAYTGSYADDTVCPDCNEDRWRLRKSGVREARARYLYVPIKPRLMHQYGSVARAKMLQTYCARFYNLQDSDDDAVIDDWWAAQHYRRLRGEGYFGSTRDIALQISFDGFQVTGRTFYHAAPIIAIILNLPPTIRYRRENIMLVGLIPGPQVYNHPDTWLQPFVDEMKELGFGESNAYDAYSQQLFTLRAHTVLFSGDGPAVAQACGMKSPGGAQVPCRVCTFEGTFVADKRRYYYPHSANDLAGHDSSGHSTYRNNLREVIETVVHAGPDAMKADGGCYQNCSVTGVRH